MSFSIYKLLIKGRTKNTKHLEGAIPEESESIEKDKI